MKSFSFYLLIALLVTTFITVSSVDAAGYRHPIPPSSPIIRPSQSTQTAPSTHMTPRIVTPKHSPTSYDHPQYTQTDWLTATTEGIAEAHAFSNGRIHIGLRYMTYSLDDTSRIGQNNNYIGTVDELKAVNDGNFLTALTLGFYPVRNFGLEYRYDRIQARTLTNTAENHSDGIFEAKGPIFLAVARLPLDKAMDLYNNWFGYGMTYQYSTAYEVAGRFSPYIGVGLANLSGSFNPETWWTDGWSSPDRWKMNGSPDEIRNNHTRKIKVSDESMGLYVMMGLSVQIIENLYADFNVAWESLDLTADFYLDEQYRSSSTIPMDYQTTSIALQYWF